MGQNAEIYRPSGFLELDLVHYGTRASCSREVLVREVRAVKTPQKYLIWE